MNLTLTKAFIAYVAVSALAVASCLYVIRGQVAQNARLSDQNAGLSKALSVAQEQREKDRKVLGAWQAKNASTARELARSRAALQEALQAAPEWSNTTVPPEVQKALLRPPGGPQ